MTTNPVITLTDATGVPISATNPLPTGSALSSAAGLPLRASSNGDGTASLGGAVSALVYPSVARTTSNAGDSFSTSSITMMAVDTTVTTFTGGTVPTITFFVQRFAGDGVWYTVWTSAAIAAPGATSVDLGPGFIGTGMAHAVFTGTARFGWTLAGTPTSVTFSAAVSCR